MPVSTAAKSGRSRQAKTEIQLSHGDMKQSVFDLFTESQHHISSHRKNVHALRQLHLDWCGRAGDAEREEAFFLVFLQCLNIVLSVKRKEEAVSRVIRFIVGFIVLSAEKDEDVAKFGSSVTSRFIENLMLYSMEGIDAKEKTVRARLCQVIVACVNSVDELSDHVWETFRAKMIERLFDKEASVRVHAVLALARLQSLPIDEDGNVQMLDLFMDLLQHDPSVEVRKTVLAQIDVVDKSLPVILERKRDQDPRIRRFFYTNKLAEVDIRSLSVQQRDEVLRTGLTDRDQSVKQACINMIFTNWIHDTNSNLIEFLGCLDVMSNTAMAESALECFFDMNQDMFTNFNAQYLENLTVETAFILRVFCQYTLKKTSDATVVQEMLPELVQMSSYIRRAYESYLTCDLDDPARGEIEFVLQELLQTCRHLDFSDEVGRRVLADALLELLTNLELADPVFTQALQLMILQSPALPEFIEVAAGLIADFKDVYQADGSIASTEEGIQKSLEALTLDSVVPEDVRILANLRCLEIIRELYTLLTLQKEDEEALLSDTLTEIVIPAVNSQFAAVQTAGLHCLGLACTLNKDLAAEYMVLFMDFVRLGQDDTALVALKTAFDLIFLFGTSLSENLESILSLSLYDPRGPIQTVASEGFAKLLLHGIIPDNGILEGLLHLYYSQVTESEPRLRQCLAYFFPAFGHSKPQNQLALARVVVPFLKTFQPSSNLSFGDVASQLAFFTDPASLINGQENQGSHDLIAIDAVWNMLDNLQSTKSFLMLLNRLNLSSLAKLTVKKVIYLLAQLSKLVQEKTTMASLKKFISAIVELDDVEVTIDPEDLAGMKQRLAPIMAGLPQSTSASMAVLNRKQSAPKQQVEVNNILDDLDDILQ